MENGLIFVWTMFYIGCITVETVRRENRCMRHYFVATIKHPSKDCDTKVRIRIEK
jgi:hypothetical protein